MKKLLFLCSLFLSLVATSQETPNYPKYTLSQIYEMIENETSDTFTLKNATIILDTVADRNYLIRKFGLSSFVSMPKDSIEIHKSVVFENVFTQTVNLSDTYIPAFNKVIFHKPVILKNSELWFLYNHFKSEVDITYDDNLHEHLNENFSNENEYAQLVFRENKFEFDPKIEADSEKQEKLRVSIRMEDCVLKGANASGFVNWDFRAFFRVVIIDNQFLDTCHNFIFFSSIRGIINNNDFGQRIVRLTIRDEGYKRLEFRENKINQTFFLSLPESIQNLQIDWSQFSSNVINSGDYNDFIQRISTFNNFSDYMASLQDEKKIKKYIDSARIVNRLFYKSEIGLLGTLNSIYKRQHDLESARASYIALKNLETKRLEYLYDQAPSFDTYFEWKVNQFLKLFSDYGTRPAKAIVVSVYVILFFALIYLFFPNSWDSHGKNRIMDRYRFFTKYMNKEAGIHQVYLEERKEELLASEDFKNYMLSSKKRVPKFFLATAIPLYTWSVSGTKLSAAFLRRIDIMNGSWQDLPQHKRLWKSILLIGAFVIAVLYDLFIKTLNALMLSINTFTTLGFGEIPIKGLPRYLAIIQGFIGWFMLTIFSVSLISQLLN